MQSKSLDHRVVEYTTIPTVLQAMQSDLRYVYHIQPYYPA